MMSKSSAGIGGLCVAVGILVAGGCSHDTLETNTVGLTIQYAPSQTGVGRYESATFQISEIRLVPADPVRRGLLEGSNLSLNVIINANLTSSATTSFNQIALTPGLYNIVGVQYGLPVLKDNDPPGAPPCIEGVSDIPGGATGTQFISFDESAGLVVNVLPGSTAIVVRVDVPALISGYEGAFTCQESCGGGGACLTAFDENAFRTTLLSAVAITVQ